MVYSWNVYSTLSYHQCQCSILIGWKLENISCIRLFCQEKVYRALSCLIFSVSGQLWRHLCLCWVRWLNRTRHDVIRSRRSFVSDTERKHFLHVCSMMTKIWKQPHTAEKLLMTIWLIFANVHVWVGCQSEALGLLVVFVLFCRGSCGKVIG